MARVARGEAPRTKKKPEWWHLVPADLRQVLKEAAESERPNENIGEHTIRRRPNLFLHEKSKQPTLRWMSNYWPRALDRLVAANPNLTGTFRFIGPNWVLFKPGGR